MHGVRSFEPLFFIAFWLSLPAQAQVYRLADLNTEQIRALNPMKTAAIIPGGILEEHGPYLPSYSDGFFAEAYSRELANAIVSRPGWTVLMFPQIPLGGPPIVLTRGQPVEIEVVNRLKDPTAIHWHGIELESYYDGVPGWSGAGTKITPPIAPGTSCVARMTPPSAGTFIYHTHWHDQFQLINGIYGQLIVLPPGEQLVELPRNPLQFFR
jgi:FtsP/CotA-like multicopper oxidase with cupredoxin domain